EPLEFAYARFVECRDALRRHLCLGQHDVLERGEEPWVDPAQIVHFLQRQAPRNASARWNTRSGRGSRSSRLSTTRPSSVVMSNPVGLSPVLPISSPRSAFCSDSWKLRPTAIT